MFDVRFIENPYFTPELRPQSGLDQPVREFILAKPAAQGFIEHAEGMLSFLIPAYEREGKSYLTVGFGCTGGRHRSVALAEYLAEAVRTKVGTRIDVTHRDMLRVHFEALERERVEAATRGVPFQQNTESPRRRKRD